MASLKCSFCGHGIHYHSEPDDTEYVFCNESDWAKMEQSEFLSSRLELEYDTFVYAWKCSECGTFAFFDSRGRVTGVYTPDNEFTGDIMTEPAQFGPFFDDRLWYDITEEDVRASEILDKYPQHRWLLKNDSMMRVFADRARTKCIAQYRRIPVAER